MNMDEIVEMRGRVRNLEHAHLEAIQVVEGILGIAMLMEDAREIDDNQKDRLSRAFARLSNQAVDIIGAQECEIEPLLKHLKDKEHEALSKDQGGA